MDGLLLLANGLWANVVAFFAFDAARLTEWDMILRIVLQVFLFAISAFFSGSETALFSLSRLDLQKLRRDRHPHSETLHRLLDHPRRLIISILCGNELVNIAATANLVGILVALYDTERAALINILVMFPLVLLFGEVTPKTIAVSNPVRISANLVAGPVATWVRLVTPLRETIRIVSDRATTLIVGEERPMENILGRDEFRTLISEVTEEGVIDATERVLIDNLLEAGETEIVEIMTPRTRTAFIDVNQPVANIVDEFRRIEHPRVPVYEKHRDNLVGFVHAEDIMRMVLDKVDLTQVKVRKILHPPVVVPPTKSIDEMFDFFQNNNARAAIVLNEFGGVDGFITMRDVLNYIFGEISEDVRGQELYQERDQDVYEVNGAMKLTDFNDLTNYGIWDPRMTTIGGVVFRFLDRLPQVGDRVGLENGVTATVLEMDGHRLARVRVARGEDPERPADAEAQTEADAPDGADATDETSARPPEEEISMPKEEGTL
ncbi:MAG: hemolysin family protein [Magnetospiraceae bacterium]